MLGTKKFQRSQLPVSTNIPSCASENHYESFLYLIWSGASDALVEPGVRGRQAVSETPTAPGPGRARGRQNAATALCSPSRGMRVREGMKRGTKGRRTGQEKQREKRQIEWYSLREHQAVSGKVGCTAPGCFYLGPGLCRLFVSKGLLPAVFWPLTFYALLRSRVSLIRSGPIRRHPAVPGLRCAVGNYRQGQAGKYQLWFLQSRLCRTLVGLQRSALLSADESCGRSRAKVMSEQFRNLG